MLYHIDWAFGHIRALIAVRIYSSSIHEPGQNIGIRIFRNKMSFSSAGAIVVHFYLTFRLSLLKFQYEEIYETPAGRKFLENMPAMLQIIIIFLLQFFFAMTMC